MKLTSLYYSKTEITFQAFTLAKPLFSLV